MATDPRLDERELEILQLLWKHGPQKPGQLQERLSFEMKNSGLRWLLNDLVERGQLHRQKEGKAFLYSAAVERRPLLEVLGRRLQDLLFGGSAMAMIGELIDVQKLSPEDIEHLKKVAQQKESAGNSEQGNGRNAQPESKS
ncbi:MAG TPA: BlaI/MecI/CopY family transcriptional regulator [Candidatus Methylacidiphilales bacterium]|nr:BlaI/MecI/CopY family transcriptional regulator [Candidatus Methylacidiphilales bacterium]